MPLAPPHRWWARVCLIALHCIASQLTHISLRSVSVSVCARLGRVPPVRHVSFVLRPTGFRKDLHHAGYAGETQSPGEGRGEGKVLDRRSAPHDADTPVFFFVVVFVFCFLIVFFILFCISFAGSKEDPGVNIRALTKLFEVAAERFPDVKYDIKVSLLEIYNVSPNEQTTVFALHSPASAPCRGCTCARARYAWPHSTSRIVLTLHLSIGAPFVFSTAAAARLPCVHPHHRRKFKICWARRAECSRPFRGSMAWRCRT